MNLSELQFPHLENGNCGTHITGLLLGTNEEEHGKGPDGAYPSMGGLAIDLSPILLEDKSPTLLLLLR